MANVVEPKLTDDLVQALQEERLVTIATIDHETGSPNVSVISWVYAISEDTVRLAVDQRSRIVANIRSNSSIVLTVMADESVYSISGVASIRAERLEGVPLKLSLVEIKVKEVRDVMFYGSKIAVEPKYEKTYDPRAAAKLDNQVLQAIKGF
ncbi:pyridoxamine 5'-phosphate oxidase family protein [Bacillus sp. 165]|uniref:pyridoxamine 5'-phosphate oxidase family protein n=1 Tax=Bacillus sp. 165 TaxID=1529117 RepID=UPI001ADC5502|nr:pyridoxamine 5'-phosphate oxidase family protein [Bacillus sp. 165]MBO9130308.1 pyridoxamine 5'-phosphate oxidase family protein [Bacillus sp. 165]